MERTIRLRTRDRRYVKNASYPFVPAQRGINGVYLTGQIIDPSDPKTKSYLTLSEATGATQLTPTKQKQFPYIINPFDILPLVNNMKLQVGIQEDGTPYNERDYAIWLMLLLNDHLIGASETVYNPTKHVFYFEDVIALAEVKTSMKRKENKLMNNIFALTPQRMRDLMLLIAIYEPTFKENPDNLSIVLIEDKIIKVVEKNVNLLADVFDKSGGFSKKATEDLMIAKLVHIGEIRINISEFYYKNVFLGNTVEDVKKWMRDKANHDVMNKWSAIISKGEVEGLSAVETKNEIFLKIPEKKAVKDIDVEDKKDITIKAT